MKLKTEQEIQSIEEKITKLFDFASQIQKEGGQSATLDLISKEINRLMLIVSKNI